MEIIINGIFFEPLFWLALGIVLMLFEVIHGAAVLLSFGLSSVSMALIFWVTGIQLAPLWSFALFAVIGMFIAVVMRRLLHKTANYKNDINIY